MHLNAVELHSKFMYVHRQSTLGQTGYLPTLTIIWKTKQIKQIRLYQRFKKQIRYPKQFPNLLIFQVPRQHYLTYLCYFELSYSGRGYICPAGPRLPFWKFHSECFPVSPFNRYVPAAKPWPALCGAAYEIWLRCSRWSWFCPHGRSQTFFMRWDFLWNFLWDYWPRNTGIHYFIRLCTPWQIRDAKSYTTSSSFHLYVGLASCLFVLVINSTTFLQDKFQKDFWLLRQSEQESYNLMYTPLKPRLASSVLITPVTPLLLYMHVSCVRRVRTTVWSDICIEYYCTDESCVCMTSVSC